MNKATKHNEDLKTMLAEQKKKTTTLYRLS